jgi:hypothetical protein
MTASQVIGEIAALPPAEQAEVIRYACRLEAERKFTGPELGALAEKLTRTTDPVETAALRESIMRGFYGGQTRA